MPEETLIEIVSSLKNTELWSDVRKIWKYKDNILVVDMTRNGINFAFDLVPLENGLFSIDLVQRKIDLEFKINPSGSKKVNISYNNSLGDSLSLIKASARNIIDRIDRYFANSEESDDHSKDDIRDARGHPLCIGVMTLPLNKNFGGNLQAFAMMEVLKRLGHKPVFINRRHPPKESMDDAVIETVVDDRIFSDTYGMSETVQNSSFIDAHIKPMTKRFDSSSELSRNLDKYQFDALLVGSDQVWRAKYARTILEDFFFGFASDSDRAVRRISYAASFGADKIAYGDSVEKITHLIRKFDAVSVREDRAIAICQEKFGVDAQHVLDPTLLLVPDDYVRLFAGKKIDHSGDRILAYVLDADEDKTKIVHDISKKLSLTVYGANGCPLGLLGALKVEDGDRSVEGWLASFHGAKFVVTDSFHGVAFCILFNKPFIAYGNPKRGMTRFTSLLKSFGLTERLIVDSANIDLETLLQPIDWRKVNTRLALLREKSLDFLRKALSTTEPAQSAADGSRGQRREAAIAENPLNVLCTGCGVCVSESKGTLRMAWNKDGFLIPKAVSDHVPDHAVKVCPFNPHPDKAVEDEDALGTIFLSDAEKYDPVAGRFQNTYVGFSRKYRASSSSGGISTYVLEKLMQRRDVDYLFVVRGDGDSGYEYAVCSDVDQIKLISKTRYFPVSLEHLFTVIDRTEGRVAVSGVACFIKAVRLKQHYHPIYREKIAFLLGIICGGLKSRQYTDFLAQSAEIVGPYKHPEYRVKDPNSKSSDYSFSAVDSKSRVHEIKMRRIGGNWGVGLFKAKACDFCSDVLTELADISVGDAWLPGYREDGMGHNVVVTRSRLADEIINAGIEAGELVMDAVPLSEVIRSQSGGVNHKRNGLKFRAWTAKYFLDLPVPHLRSRLLKNIPIPEAIVQIHRERTRSKSFEYWQETRDAKAFQARMKASKQALKVATDARKDGSHASLISILEGKQVNPALIDQADRKQPAWRWLRRLAHDRKLGIGLIRAALLGDGAVTTSEK